MASVRIVLNRRGVGDVLTFPGVERWLMDKAEAVADTARSRAPFQTGDYRDSIEADVVAGRTKRAAAEVRATAPHSLVVESRLRVLGSSLDAVGDPGAVKREYTTRDGRTIMATDAQISNWTRGRRS